MESYRLPLSLSTLSLLLIVQVVFIGFSFAQDAPASNDTTRVRRAPGVCAMYDICGARSDGKVLNCPLNTPAVKPEALFSSKIQSLCPTITGDVCCTEKQFDTLRAQVQQVIPFLVGCPACLRNFLNVFCEMSCSPNQSLFIDVTATKKVNNSLTVDGIKFYVTDAFGEGLFDSCKEVKFGTMNTRAIEFVAGGAHDFKGWFAFIGRQVGPNVPGSPYLINFTSSLPASSGMRPMNVSAYSCSDTSLGCSCGDCPSSPACSSSAPPPVTKSNICSVKLGSVKARCSDIAVAVVFVVMVSVICGWGFFHQKSQTSPDSRTKPLTNTTGSDKMHSSDPKDGDLPLPILFDQARLSGEAKLSVVQGYMSNFYRKYGVWAARRPALVLFSSLAIVLVLCVGLIRFKVETRPEKLWVGPGSRAAKEKEFFDSHLAPFYRVEQLMIATVPNKGEVKSPTILTEDNIKLLFEIQKKVDGIRSNFSGSMVSLTDICFKPLGQACATQSILQYFKMDPANFDNFGGLDHVDYCFQHYTSTESCLSAFKAPLDPSTALGGYSGNNYSEASAFIITYPVTNAIDKESNETKRAVSWEKAFIQLAKALSYGKDMEEMSNLNFEDLYASLGNIARGISIRDELVAMVQTKKLTISFSSESSIEEELKRESTADVMTIVVSYLVMFAYISLTLGDMPQLSSLFISSKVLLGLSGVMLVMLSVLGSVGLFSALGVKSTLIIMEVIPFLVLAVGVDNMCILVHAVKRQPQDLSLDDRVSNALVEVGPSITLASISEVLAFTVGTFIPMPAVRVFSMFAALAVLLDFLLQVTAFVALIVLDFRRAEDHRIDCIPCVKTTSLDDTNSGIGNRKRGLLAYYMKEVHARILSLWAVKVLVVSVFTGLALASVTLSTRIEPGLEQQIVLPKNSYLQGYFQNLSDFLRIGPPVYFVVKDFNYSSESRQANQLCSISHCDENSLVNEITKASLVPESSYIAKPAASWIDDYLVWVSPEAFGCCRKFANGSYCPPDDQPPCCAPDQVTCGVSELCKDCTTCFLHSELINDRPTTAQFKVKLPWFLDALPSADCAKGGHGAYSNSVDLKGYENGVIRASEFRTYHTPLNKQSDFINSLKAAREFTSRVSKSLQMEVFPYSVFYMFFEQYLDIWRTALINLAIAIGAVFIVCLVITWSIWSSLIILLVITMIVLDLLGVMAILGIQLNAVSVVNLVMSVGIAVEFCVHITHAFMVSAGSRDQRMKEALGTMGASVFSGITLTKLVGVVVLAFSRSQVFVVYYFQMYLALVLLGFLHGLIFLPVVLSLFGPPSRVILENGDPRPSTSSQF